MGLPAHSMAPYPPAVTRGSPPRPAAIDVAIVEDVRQIRDGLAAFIAEDRGFRCVGRYGSVEEALRHGATPPPRIVLVDLGGPGTPGVRVIGLFRDLRPPDTIEHDLTPHEVRLLRLLVDGHNYKTASRVLKVSVNTISFHMRSIYNKLHVHSKAEAVSKALRQRIVQ